MFIGMSFCLPLGWLLEYIERRKKSTAPEEEKLLDAEPLLAVDQVNKTLTSWPLSLQPLSVC